jgi:hypothetical protein
MKIFCLIILFWVVETGIAQNHFYVSSAGNDQNDGTFSNPFLTLQRSLEKVNQGDTIFIRGGQYMISDRISISKNGASGMPVVIMSFRNEKAIFDAGNFKPRQGNNDSGRFHRNGVIHIENASWIILSGITVINSHATGIMVSGKNTKNIILSECITKGSFSSGIAVWYADSVTVTGCEVVGANDPALQPEGEPSRSETPHEGITIAGATHFDVNNNKIHDCYKEGIDCKEVSAHGIIHHNHCYHLPRQGLYVDSWFGLLEDVEFYGNIVDDCEWGIGICSEGKGSSMKNVRIHHNIIYDNRGSGIFFGVWGNDELRSDIYIYNNTLVHNGSRDHWAGPTGGIDVRSRNLKNIYIYNNICCWNFSFEIGTFDDPDDAIDSLKEKNIAVSNNLSGSFKSTPFPGGYYGPVYGIKGKNFIEGDPMFHDSKNGDFRPEPHSPSLDGALKGSPYGSDAFMGALPEMKSLP